MNITKFAFFLIIFPAAFFSIFLKCNCYYYYCI